MTLRAILPRLVLTLVIAGAAIFLALNRDQLDPALIESSIRDLGPWAPLVHVVLFAFGTVLFVPGAIFGLAGGALFGPLWGTLLNLAGATLGATASFLIARYLAADWVRRQAGGRLESLIARVEAEGWRFVAFVRLVPLFPFNLTNYALGLTRIRFVPYVVTSFICMAPGAIAYTWLGHAGREALAGDTSAIRYGMLALGLLAAIAFAPRLVNRLRQGTAPRWIGTKELANELGSGAATIIDVRSPDEFTAPGHIETALNIPLGELPDRLTEIRAHKNKPVIVVCKTDKRAASAATLLSAGGFSDVRVLRGGMERWKRDGLAVAGNGTSGRVDTVA
jgi:uncharacterized membrane protein YdjX (TVP38/TMEM64 family)/rhodanese-related sulfurtransferase